MLLLFQALLLNAQPGDAASSRKALYDTIRQMDSIFFNAFNSCDTVTMKAMFTSDLEFYHDKGGLTNYQQNLQSIRSRCSSEGKVRRELVLSSLEVHPIPNYGAIQVGEHKFYYTEPGKLEKYSGTFKFAHVWLRANGRWQMSRVISYDH